MRGTIPIPAPMLPPRLGHQELLAARGIYFKLFELQYESRQTAAQ